MIPCYCILNNNIIDGYWSLYFPYIKMDERVKFLESVVFGTFCFIILFIVFNFKSDKLILFIVFDFTSEMNCVSLYANSILSIKFNWIFVFLYEYYFGNQDYFILRFEITILHGPYVIHFMIYFQYRLQYTFNMDLMQ